MGEPYVPYVHTARTYRVPPRENDSAEGRQWTEATADELTGEEFAYLSPEDQAAAWEDIRADGVTAAIGADAADAWRDHEHGRDTERPRHAA